jgi:hypothetical protein
MNVGFNAAAVRKYQPAFENLAHEVGLFRYTYLFMVNQLCFHSSQSDWKQPRGPRSIYCHPWGLLH